MARVPQRYIPKHLSAKDTKQVRNELKKSRREYEKGRYHVRRKVKSFKGRKSRWIDKTRKIYRIPESKALTLDLLEKKTGCNKRGLKKIISKGKGAYFSSGSRPNQTPTSWGRARLYSAISGGPASKIDSKLLRSSCKKSSIALKLAKKYIDAAMTKRGKKTQL